jgi:hypothetical protein
MKINKIKNLNLSSNIQLINVLSANSEITNKILGFQTAVKQLDSYEKKMMNLYSKLGKESTSVGNAKNEHRTELLERTIPVITILDIFAYDKKKRKLQKQLKHLTAEYLNKCSDNKLIKISKKIWTIANKHGVYSLAFISKNKSSLNTYKSKVALLKNGYGLMPEMIKNIEEANIKFVESLIYYEDELKEKAKIVKKIKKINKQTAKLLEKKLDRYVGLFESENPGFFKEYQKIREIQLHSGESNADSNDQLVVSDDLKVEELDVKKVQSKLKPKIQQRSTNVKVIEV